MENENLRQVNKELNWTLLRHENFSEGLKSLLALPTASDEIKSDDNHQIKIQLREDINDLSSINFKKLSQKFKNKSVLMFFEVNDGKKFFIYWKSKDIKQFLSLKPYKNSFSLVDKPLCEYVAEILSNFLENGYLGVHQNHDIWSNQGKIELHSIIDSRNYNLLLLASEAGNVKPINALLKYGIESQLVESEVTAQSLAWQGRHSDVLLKFLRANLSFPLDVDKNECSEELKKFIETCEEVHKMIESKNEERLREILDENPHLSYFYNLSNKSALKAALDLKLIEIYELLISKNLPFAPHEDTDEIWEQFSRSEKIKLRNINLKYAKGIPEKHINVLMFNTSLSHDEEDEEGKRKLVLRAYRTLNSDPRLKIVLKIVAATKIFHIFFDFHRDSTYRIDPTTGPRTQGIFYFSGRIIVGAKQLLDPDREREAIGVLIHELCHYACLAVFENQSDPYKANDQEAKEEFARIMAICMERKDEEPVIQSVFDDYPEEHQPSELIVRPPHLIALYSHQPDILQEVSETFNELFHYYLNFVVPAMERALPEIEVRLAYRPAQKYSMLSDQKKLEVQNAVVKYKNVEVKLSELFPGNFDIFEKLTSDHISQILESKELNFYDPHLRYLDELVSLKWENLAESLKEKFLNSNLNFQGEMIKFRDLNENCSNAFISLTSNQIISILNDEGTEIGEKLKSEVDFYIERQFLPEDAELMGFEYAYGHEYVDVYETRTAHLTSRVFNTKFSKFTDEFLQQSFEVRKNILDKVKENNFFKKKVSILHSYIYHFMHKNSSKIIEKVQNERIFILSSEAGAGKTVTFERLAMEIKKKFPTRWVSYIDLKAHTGFYKTSGSPENVEELLSKILRLGSEINEFEVRIFEESYRSGTAVLVWNGFDEISPNYNEFILNLINLIHNKSKNIQLVCTRPLYSDQLSQAFKIRTWDLVAFDESKKNEFLKKTFISQNLSRNKMKKCMKKVRQIIEKLNFKNLIPYNFDNPLMLKLVAEVNGNEDLLESANIYEIFRIFVEKKIEIWLKKSESTFNVATKLLIGGSFKILFQKHGILRQLVIFSGRTLALKLRKLKLMQNQIPSDLSFEEISGMGILYINGKNDFEFVHRTFVDFFVAQYFIENIYNASDDLSTEEAELRLELFFHIAQGFRNNQRLITDFMSSFLQLRNENDRKSFHPVISELLRTKFRKFFIRLLDSNHPAVYAFLFEFFKRDHDLLVDLLHVHEDETFYTAIFNPNHFGLFTNAEKIRNLAKLYLTDEELRKLLNGRNQKGKILLGMQFYKLIGVKKSNEAFLKESNSLGNSSFWKSVQKIAKNLTENETKELFVTIMSPKIYLFYDGNFNFSNFSEYEKLWEHFENLLSTFEMQDALGNALIHFSEIYPCEKADKEIFISFLLEKVEKFLSSPQIYEMFFTKNILHEAHRNSHGFISLWNVLSKHTNEDERREILLRDDFDDKNFYFYYMYQEPKRTFSRYSYRYFHYDFTPFKIFHKALTIPLADTLDFTVEIYQKHFTNSEIQEIIMSSNDFLYYVIEMVDEEPCKRFISHLEDLFKGNEKLLRKFLKRKVKPTNLTVFEIVEDFRGLANSLPRWFNNIQAFYDLYEKIKTL